MLKVVIVEDNEILADIVEDFLRYNDYKVCGIARAVSSAVALANWHKPDVVILDQILIGYDFGTEVAVKLRAFHRMGILYTTGNVSNVMRTATHGHACLAKPYRLDDLLRSIEIVTEMVATGTPPPPPFPHGFRVLPLAVSATSA